MKNHGLTPRGIFLFSSSQASVGTCFIHGLTPHGSTEENNRTHQLLYILHWICIIKDVAAFKPFQIIIILILIVGVILGIYLVGNPTRFLPKAASEPISNPVNPSPSTISGPITASPSPVMQGDDDSDGFTNSVELLMGTNPNKKCAENATDNAWPVDTNNNQVINGGDVSKIVPYVSGLLAYNKRYDLNLDGINNKADVETIVKYFLQECNAINPQSTPNPSVLAMYDIPNVADIIVNRKVDIFDFNKLVTEFGDTGPGVVSDINKDEIVNIFDFNILLTNFGRTY